LFRIGWRVRNKIIIAVTIGLIEIAARTILRVNRANQTGAQDETSKEYYESIGLPCHGRPLDPSTLKPCRPLAPEWQLSPSPRKSIRGYAGSISIDRSISKQFGPFSSQEEAMNFAENQRQGEANGWSVAQMNWLVRGLRRSKKELMLLGW
jgi:hypothetical protein